MKKFTFITGSSECVIQSENEIEARKKLSEALQNAEYSRRFSDNESKRAVLKSIE